MSKIKIGIMGASGYGGGELIRTLLRHPHSEIKVATSNTYAGKPVWASFPGLQGFTDLQYSPDGDPSAFDECDLVFLARDNGQAMNFAGDYVARGIRVIDLSADFRFRDPAEYAVWYNMEHASPELTVGSDYGLPELHEQAIRQASIVGNPGCYATASILALAPLYSHELAHTDNIIVDGKSGISGAGRSKFSLDYHFPEANESVTAYKIGGTHRHTGEIEQELSAIAGAPLKVSFTPHLVPMTRGILLTAYANLVGEKSTADLLGIYREFYAKAPFVQVVDKLPSTKHVAGSNMCHIGLSVDPRTNRVTVISVIDNLGKGMVGQAIQNMNIMFHQRQENGLLAPGLWP
ncbi:MAG: N-acetyl-gamma-glutamyl-phosphate reductase [Chthonomonadales bacterium]